MVARLFFGVVFPWPALQRLSILRLGELPDKDKNEGDCPQNEKEMGESQVMSRSAVARISAKIFPVLLLLAVMADTLAAQVTPEAPGFRPGREKIVPPEPVRPKVKIDLQIPEGGRVFREELEKITFFLEKIEIAGVTVYAEEEIRLLYEDLLGKEISLARIYDVEEKITLKYRQDGYVLSRAIVPEQRIRDGVARISVVEGFIARISIEGAEPMQSRILAFLNKIVGRKPLRLQDLERYLLLVNDMAGVTTRNIIRPAKDAPGASELVVVAERRMLDGYLSYDNYGSYYLGPERATLGLNLNSPFGQGERFSFTGLLTNPTTELKYIQGDASLPLGTEGLSLNGSMSEEPSRPDDDLRLLETEGNTYIKTVSLTYPWLRTRNASLLVETGYMHLKYLLHVLDDKLLEDRIPKFYATATLDFLDQYAGANTIILTVNQGLDWSATPKNSLYSTRYEASPEFNDFNGELRRMQYLDLLTPGLGLLTRFLWQYSDEPLFSSEEFGIGGRIIGRGYDDGEILGDKGVGFSAELQYLTPVYHEFSAQLYTFYDAGKVWNVDDIDENTDNEKPDLESAGLGLRLFWRENVTLHWEVAKPLSRIPSRQNDRDPWYSCAVLFSF
ncbi:MAG: ShlB/FhaC/HecB family hemolysin secretion/activation protein [Desulfurivibrio sp.]|nr:MAG: ShlB/FhaC/HecB family hemolysin secretion/activation protein [Desulfurivibrio sp.]